MGNLTASAALFEIVEFQWFFKTPSIKSNASENYRAWMGSTRASSKVFKNFSKSSRIFWIQRSKLVSSWNYQTRRTMEKSDRVWRRILWLLVICCFDFVLLLFCNKNSFFVFVTKLSCQPNNSSAWDIYLENLISLRFAAFAL